MGMSLFTVFVSAVWVVANRGHAVVVAAQPPFLYGLFFGATVMSFVIFCFSFDESYGWDGAQLSRACVAVPWLACTGTSCLKRPISHCFGKHILRSSTSIQQAI